MNDLTELVPIISRLVGIDSSTLLLYLGLAVTVSNIVSRLIPDDATGWLGTTRKIASVVGIYVSNRVTSGVTTNDVVKSVVTQAVPGVLEAAKDPGALINQVVEDAGEEILEKVVPAFPGLSTVLRDTASGKFTKRPEGESI